MDAEEMFKQFQESLGQFDPFEKADELKVPPSPLLASPRRTSIEARTWRCPWS